MTYMYDKFFASGEWKKPPSSFEDLNPSDDSVWANVADASRVDVKNAINSAHEAFQEWSTLPFTTRAEFMLKIAAEIERRKDDLVKAVQGEGGGWFGKGMYEAHALQRLPQAGACRPVTQDNKADEDQERGMHIHADAAKLPDFPGPFHAF